MQVNVPIAGFCNNPGRVWPELLQSGRIGAETKAFSSPAINGT